MIQIRISELKEALKNVEIEIERNGHFCTDLLQIELLNENPNDDGRPDNVQIYLGMKPEYRSNNPRMRGYQVFGSYKTFRYS